MDLYSRVLRADPKTVEIKTAVEQLKLLEAVEIKPPKVAAVALWACARLARRPVVESRACLARAAATVLVPDPWPQVEDVADLCPLAPAAA
ncbi:hypothetical protein U9M48_029174 [Paspalum notatum var. saurae]|uniref:Uncharacterized protein n=1 Tax=Paspalum notatum var. saurae TaxID=547442 RepID=A0AAQ3U2Q6_PASNO